MLGTSAGPETVPGSLDLQAQPAGLLPFASRFRPLGLVVVAALVAVGAWYAAQVIVLDHSAAAAVNASVAQTTSPLRPDASIQITASGHESPCSGRDADIFVGGGRTKDPLLAASAGVADPSQAQDDTRL